jgi:hypothetical protein
MDKVKSIRLHNLFFVPVSVPVPVPELSTYHFDQHGYDTNK